MVYEDAKLASISSTIKSLEILGAKMWWHVKEKGNMYEKVITKTNNVISVLWSNNRKCSVKVKRLLVLFGLTKETVVYSLVLMIW
jgi:hypothetical protein